MKLMLWAIFNEWQTLKMFLRILQGSHYSRRQERLRTMLAQYASQEINNIRSIISKQP